MISMLDGTFCGCISMTVTGIGPILGGPPAVLSPEHPAAASAPITAETTKGSALRWNFEVGVTPVLLDYFCWLDYKHSWMYVNTNL
jgi:hypothetical protein